MREHCPRSRLTLPLRLVVVEGELSTIDVSQRVALEGATSERRERCRRIFQRGVAKVLANIPDVRRQITSPANQWWDDVLLTAREKRLLVENRLNRF
jgi:hypothetical protein